MLLISQSGLSVDQYLQFWGDEISLVVNLSPSVNIIFLENVVSFKNCTIGVKWTVQHASRLSYSQVHRWYSFALNTFLSTWNVRLRKHIKSTKKSRHLKNLTILSWLMTFIIEFFTEIKIVTGMERSSDYYITNNWS